MNRHIRCYSSCLKYVQSSSIFKWFLSNLAFKLRHSHLSNFESNSYASMLRSAIKFDNFVSCFIWISNTALCSYLFWSVIFTVPVMFVLQFTALARESWMYRNVTWCLPRIYIAYSIKYQKQNSCSNSQKLIFYFLCVSSVMSYFSLLV
jgi:hypothetical protein